MSAQHIALAPGLTTLIAETTIVCLFRGAVFLACRKYLLRALYHDLQDLSGTSGTDPGTPIGDHANHIELGTLPSPSVASPSHTKHARDRSLHFTLARSSFALCFSESCVLFLLLICQSADIFDPQTRAFNWRISLYLLLASNLVFQPLFLSYAITLKRRTSSSAASRTSLITRAILTVSPVAAYLFLLTYIPIPAALASSDFATAVLARLTVLGTIVLGLLSGYGAICNVWLFLPLLSRSQKEPPTATEVETSERSLARIRNDLDQRRADLRKREAAATTPATDASWFSRVLPNLRGDAGLTAAIQEIQGLEALEYQMTRNVETLKQRLANAQFSGTIIGQIVNFGGRFFALYCIFRVLNSLVNIVTPFRYASASPGDNAERPTSSPDMITAFLATLLTLAPSVSLDRETIVALSRQISLFLVGVIILSSVRVVLRGVTRLLRVTSRNLGASLMLVLLAQLMVIYLLSTLIQMRTSFPPPPPSSTPSPGTQSEPFNLFSTLPEFHVFGMLFDWCFVVSAVVSLVVRWVDDKVNT